MGEWETKRQRDEEIGQGEKGKERQGERETR
jgi:hypothetical protein